MKKKVTVVIPNYNGLKFMEPCFQALSRQTSKAFDLLVVDNGSADGSAEWLREHKIPSIFLKENTGFSGAVNRGIQAAKTPYVILLNNDTQVFPEFVEELLRCIERSPKIFSVSSKMLQMYKPELLDDAGDMYTLMGWAFQRGVGQSSKGYKSACRVFSACAGAAIYRKSVFEEIGYFDEMHFAYVEAMDLGYRAQIAGYDNLYCPGAKVYHVGSGTSGSKYNSFKVKLAARNNIYLNYKNMPGPQLLLNSLPLGAGIFVKYLFFKKKGFAADYVEGLKEGLKTARKCKKVPFKRENLSNYAAIEWELLAGTLIYIYEFSIRQLKKFSIL